MARITIESEPLHFTESGRQDGPALLLIHGSGGDASHWPGALRNADDLRVHAVDLPGHGRSGGRGRSRVDDYADIIDAFVVGAGLSEVVLCGHSLGGAIAQMLALRRPDWLDRIILVGTGARLRVAPGIVDGLSSDFDSTVKLIADWAFGSSTPDNLIRQYRAGLTRLDPAVTAGDFTACDRFDIMDRVSAIQCPTLIVSGSEDRLTPVKYGAYLESCIPGARHIVIENAGHMMAIERSKQFIDAVRRFLFAP